MPGQFLTKAERERLQSFPEQITTDEIIIFFTLSDKDLILVRKRSGDHNLLGFALQLGTLRYLSFIPDNFPKLPLQVIEYVAQQLNVSSKAIADYGERSQTRTSQLQEIQDYLGFRKPNQTDYQQLDKWLLERAMEHDRPLLLFQLLIKKLEIAKIIRPGLTILERMVAYARNEAWTETTIRLQPILTEGCEQFLDSLLEVEAEKQRTPLAWLRTGAVSNSPRAIKNALAKLDFLNQQNVKDWDVSVLNPNRLKFLAKLGKKSPTQALSRTSEPRRYSILIAFCSQIYTEIIDETIDLYISTLANTHARSKKDRDLFQRQIAQSLNQKIKLLNKIGGMILDEEIQDEQLRNHIYDQITPEELEEAITECKSLMRPHADDYFDFFALRYSYLRQFVPAFLAAFSFRANLTDDPLIEAIKIIRHLDTNGKRKVPDHVSLKFIPKRWSEYVINQEGKIVRKYYELCLLWELRTALRSGNIWIINSRRYANPESYLIPKNQWSKLKLEVCQQIQVSLVASHTLELKKQELSQLLSHSLKLGWVTASLFLSKLKSFPQQNDLASSFAEYGRMIKTIFILRYLMNQPYRRKINNQLNKGERLHDLRRFLFFAHQGAIRQRHEEELTNQASCLNLITNAVVTWNTIYMEAAINQLRSEGHNFSDEDIRRLSPTRYEHVNPYGIYPFDIEKESKRVSLRPLRKPSIS